MHAPGVGQSFLRGIVMQHRLSEWMKCSCLSAAIVSACVMTVTAAELDSPRQITARIDSAPQEHPLVPALKLADAALQKVASLTDYQALFVKKEYVNGTFVEHKMEICFRRRPMSVHLKFVEPHAGRQAVYVQGQNGGQMQVKDTGLASLVGTINIDPNGSMAMAESKYPITMIGMENMTRRIMSEWLEATSRDDITVNFYPNAKIGELECQVVESTHTDAVKSKGIYRARVYIDKASGLPIRIQEFGFPTRTGAEPPLLSDYAYLNVRANTGLTAADFDTK